MAKLKLPNGKMIQVEDGLSESQMDEVVDDAMRSSPSQPAEKATPSFLDKVKEQAAGFGAGLTKQAPGSYTAGGFLRTAIDPYMDLAEGIKTGEFNQTPALESFKSGYSDTKRGVDKLSNKAPIASAAGQVVAAVPEYATGMGLFGKGSKLAQLAKGALTNTAIGQGARGPEVDLKESAIDAATGAGGEALGLGLGRLAEGIPGMRAKLYNSALGVTPKEVQAGKNIGKDIVDMGGMVGTQKGLFNKAVSGIDAQEEALQNILSKTSSPINRDIVENELKNLVGQFKGQPLGEADSQVAQSLVDEWVGKFANIKSASEANELKREIYQMLGDNPYMKINLPAKQKSFKTFGRGLNNAINDISPEARPVNKKLGTFLGIKKKLGAQLAKETSGRSSLIDAVQNTGLGAAGYAAGGAPGIPIAMAARSAAKSTLGKTTTAEMLKYLESLMKSGGANYLGPASMGRP